MVLPPRYLSRCVVGLLAAMVLFSAPLAISAAASSPLPAGVTATLTTAYSSHYLFRGQQRARSSFQPGIEFTRRQLGVGLWSNLPLGRRPPGTPGTELDPYVYYVFALTDKISVVPGCTAYLFPGANRSKGFHRATFEPNLALSGTVAGVRLTPKIYRDVVLRGTTLELTANYAFPLKQLGTELDFTAVGGDTLQTDARHRSVIPVKAAGRYWLAGIAVPFQLPGGSRVSAGFAYTRGEDAFLKEGRAPKVANPLATGRGIITLSYAQQF